MVQQGQQRFMLARRLCQHVMLDQQRRQPGRCHRQGSRRLHQQSRTLQEALLRLLPFTSLALQPELFMMLPMLQAEGDAGLGGESADIRQGLCSQRLA
ncbi:hypothetical protein D3C85_1029160 [compost metagenome]